jgi:hypothetical protein
MTDNQNTATYESKAEAVEDEKDLVKLWLDQIERSGSDEKEWRTDAEKAEGVYQSKEGSKPRVQYLPRQHRNHRSRALQLNPHPRCPPTICRQRSSWEGCIGYY